MSYNNDIRIEIKVVDKRTHQVYDHYKGSPLATAELLSKYAPFVLGLSIKELQLLQEKGLLEDVEEAKRYVEQERNR
jgi:hypothetical protein